MASKKFLAYTRGKKSPETRAKMSLARKLAWQRKEYRKKQEATKETLFSDPTRLAEYHKNLSTGAKASWIGRDDRRKIVAEVCRQNATKAHENPAFRKSKSDQLKAMWANPEMAGIMTACAEAARQDPEFKRKLSERTTARLLKRWQDPAYASFMADVRKRQSDGSPSKGECLLYTLLGLCQVEWLPQYKIQYNHRKYTIADAFVPSLKLVIFMDSRYWHRQPGVQEHDRIVRTALRDLGYSVFEIEDEKTPGWMDRIQEVHGL